MVATDGAWEPGAWRWYIGVEILFQEHRNHHGFISDPSPTYPVKLELAATSGLCPVTRPIFLQKKQKVSEVSTAARGEQQRHRDHGSPGWHTRDPSWNVESGSGRLDPLSSLELFGLRNKNTLWKERKHCLGDVGPGLSSIRLRYQWFLRCPALWASLLIPGVWGFPVVCLGSPNNIFQEFVIFFLGKKMYEILLWFWSCFDRYVHTLLYLPWRKQDKPVT